MTDRLCQGSHQRRNFWLAGRPAPHMMANARQAARPVISRSTLVSTSRDETRPARPVTSGSRKGDRAGGLQP